MLTDFDSQIRFILGNIDLKKTQRFLANENKEMDGYIPPSIDQLKQQAEYALRKVTLATTIVYEHGNWVATRDIHNQMLRLDFTITSVDMSEILPNWSTK